MADIILTGLPSISKVLLTKYNIEISDEDYVANLRRLTNQLWKIIPMKENDEDWRKQLDTVIIEIVGLNEIISDLHFLQLISKLEGLRECQDIPFIVFRKTVFEAIALLHGDKK